MGTDRPYEINPELSGISLAYRNNDYIADKVLPRLPVTQKVFKYRKFADDAYLNAPNTEIGRTGMPNQLNIKSTLELNEVKSHSLETELPQEDIDEAQASGAEDDLMEVHTNLVTDGLSLAREVRAAKLLCDPATYGDNTHTLSGESQLNNPKSSIIDLWTDIKKNFLIAPSHAVISDTYALYLQSHPEIVGMYKGTDYDRKGLVPLEFIKELLGLKEFIVGKAKINSAKEGQEANIVDVWGNDLLFFYQNPIARVKNGVTFGYTAEKGKREIQTFYNGRPGSHGVHYIKAVEDVNEIVASAKCGYLIKNAFQKFA